MDDIMDEPYPSDALLWGTIATKHATSWFHVDDYGMATVVKIMTGMKYWVVAHPLPDASEGCYGNPGSVEAFGQWNPEDAGEHLWEHEGVILKAGDTMFMRPNTPHYVVTIADSVVIGRHFFATSTMVPTSLGIAHTFILGNGITNVVHDCLHTLLRRMMGMWVLRYNMDGSTTNDDGHFPNLQTMDGLLDLMALGNLIELGYILDLRTYRKDPAAKEDHGEMIASRRWYRRIQKIVASIHVVYIKGRKTNVLSLFRRSLVEFAAALLTYKQNEHSKCPKVKGFSPEKLQATIEQYFKANYPELLQVFGRLTAKKHNYLYWTGPEFSIKLKLKEAKKARASREFFNFEDFTLYDLDEDFGEAHEEQESGGTTKPQSERRSQRIQKRVVSDGTFFCHLLFLITNNFQDHRLRSQKRKNKGKTSAGFFLLFLTRPGFFVLHQSTPPLVYII
jgi:hypothetical protein